MSGSIHETMTAQSSEKENEGHSRVCSEGAFAEPPEDLDSPWRRDLNRKRVASHTEAERICYA